MLKTGEESPICLLVNGRAISEDEIQTEVERLGRDPSLATIAAEPTRAARVRHAAEHSLICRALVEESAEADERPIEEALVAAELERARSLGGYGKLPDEAQLHAGIVAQLRIARTLQDLAAGALRPTELDVRAFYEAHAGNFSGPEVFQAAHIVKHVNESRDEAQALAEIGQALAELESGEDFAAVAERHSDCKGQGGDLGSFASGAMVAEFEEALLGLQPGQRTGVFRTPFGFHIAELRGRSSGHSAPYERVAPDIERVLTSMAEHSQFLRSIEALRSKADIRRVEPTFAA